MDHSLFNKLSKFLFSILNIILLVLILLSHKIYIIKSNLLKSHVCYSQLYSAGSISHKYFELALLFTTLCQVFHAVFLAECRIFREFVAHAVLRPHPKPLAELH